VLVQQAVASANDAGGSISTRLLTQDLQGQIDMACVAFAALASLVKQHDNNQMVLQAALRSGGKFVELFLKVRCLRAVFDWTVRQMPAGSSLFCHHQKHCMCVQLKKWFKQRGSREDIKRVVLSAQKGTRVVQTICAEAKAQRMGNVARLVPSTKKNLEKFVQYVRVILQESTAGRFWVGQLKHKNLRGGLPPMMPHSVPPVSTMHCCAPFVGTADDDVNQCAHTAAGEIVPATIESDDDEQDTDGDDGSAENADVEHSKDDH